VSGWGGGYVTDVPYVTGYYRQQSPALIALACQLGGVVSPSPGPDDPVSYLELGCGQGFGALVLAASNPRWIVTAVDFNPAHIATARAWAAQAGIDNVRFLEADLATLADEPASGQVPEADFVSMHGVWSWVPAAAEAGIVRLLRAKVRPGGAVQVSYNALPAWGSALGLQRTLRDCGRRLGTRSDRQAEEGLKLVKDLRTAEALQLRRSPLASLLIDRLGSMPASYLAHEYMHESFAPRFLADVATALAEAKLEWVGSVNLVENFPELTLSPEQRAIVGRLDDPLLRELVKDMCLDRSLRQDVFVRGARRVGPVARDAALRDVWLALNITREDMPYEADMPAGRAALNRGFYGPIAEAMAAGPRRVGDLLALPNLDGRRDNPTELIGILVGLELTEPVARPGAEPVAQALRFNQIIAADLRRTEPMGRPIAAASHMLGTGAPCTLFDLFAIERISAGDTAENIDGWVDDLRADADEEGARRLREALERALRVRLPILRSQGVW
jgi:SAM-dependent methyltransferase